MREYVEFRIPKSNAMGNLPTGIGQDIGYGVLKVVVETSDPLFAEIGRLHRAFRQQGRYFFAGREYIRRYTRRELEEARLLHVWPKRVFEPSGEECGTSYDDGRACPECGAGAPQTSALILDGGRVPKGVDFAQTIAGEIVVSANAVRTFRERGLTGATFDPVLLMNAGGRTSDTHFQLRVVGSCVQLDPATRAGADPFDRGSHGRCSRGDVVGLNLLSEVTIAGSGLPMADVVTTSQSVGVRRGLLRPRPLLLMSAKAARAVAEEGLKGLSVEVAHLTEGTLSTAPRFGWGDAVRIKRSAPVEMRGGQCGAVVSITEVDTHEKAGVYNCPGGSTVYQVEFGDGGDIKVEGAWLEAEEA